MSGMAENQESAVAVSFGRRPIFDDRQGLWGYELFAVGDEGSSGPAGTEDASVIRQLASSSYIGLQKLSDRGRKIMVKFSDCDVLEHLPYALPPEMAVIKISELAGAGPAVVDVLDRVKREGYRLAVADYGNNPTCQPLYRMADLLCLNASTVNASAVAAARSQEVQILVEGVTNRVLLNTCLQLGCDLFQGSFFKEPEKMSVRKLPSHQMSRLHLLQLSAVDEPDLEQLTETIQADVSVSFRLLAYLNSAAFGLSRKIESIRQAILMLGWSQVRNWLRVAILSDMSQARHASELTFLSAQRGKFLELVGAQHDYWGFASDSLFLLGLFSLLDALLGSPMGEIVTYLPLEDRLKSALCREGGNEYVPLLRLAECFEEADRTAADLSMRQLALDTGKVEAAFRQAVAWADLFSMPPVDGQPQ